ncbi:MAG: DUF4860 domain-containing protein [Oscillospiraceae bacterium]|nr:DUF4860 domain-containing protein [Oscillospiraceae bacterium]
MKNYRNTSDTISTIGSMLLFLLFAVCMMMIIAAAAGSYSRISDNYGTNFTASASIRYISNKIKSADSVDVSQNVMVLRSGGISNIIYFSDGGLYEKTVAANAEYELSGGERIFELSGMEISESESFYKISVNVGSEKCAALVRKG